MKADSVSRLFWVCVFLLLCFFLLACQSAALPVLTNTAPPPVPTSTKFPLAADAHPPQVFSDAFTAPVPLPDPLNSAGGEDSPFILPDGRTMYLWYTPDVSVPAEKQLLDGVTGIYVSNLLDGAWSQPQRVNLQDPGRLALDGCAFVLSSSGAGERMWFCSAREGYEGINWFTADFRNGQWQDWRMADFPATYQVGELHISRSGEAVYFASTRPGGQGGMDIWVSSSVDGAWQPPENLAEINSENNEGWPALSPDESELWFARNDSIWRSQKVNGEWQAPTQMFAPLAGEPALDQAGNVYFVHHFFTGETMIEADIYVSYRK